MRNSRDKSAAFVGFGFLLPKQTKCCESEIFQCRKLNHRKPNVYLKFIEKQSEASSGMCFGCERHARFLSLEEMTSKPKYTVTETANAFRREKYGRIRFFQYRRIVIQN